MWMCAAILAHKNGSQSKRNGLSTLTAATLHPCLQRSLAQLVEQSRSSRSRNAAEKTNAAMMMFNRHCKELEICALATL